MSRPPSPPSPEAAARIRDTAARKSAADADFVAAVVDAIRTGGGSVRTVAEIAEISPFTVQKWLAR